MGRQRILLDKQCPVCKKIFRPKGNNIKHCSRECWNQNRPHRGIWKNCKICKKSFYVSQCFKHLRCCSNKCRWETLKISESKIKLKCKFCGNKYITERSQVKWRGSKFCSTACHMKYKKTKYYVNKKKGNTTNAILKKRFWIIFSKYIRQRDGGVCISCGKQSNWKNMDAGHYIPKTTGLALYFDERNVNCQCTYCNRWMHGNLSKYAIVLRKKYGENILEELDKKRKEIRKISSIEYQKFIEEYKNKLNKIIK